MGQRLAFVFVFLCQNENKKLKQKKPKRENVLSLSAPVQEYLQHLQWVEACYALPCIKQPKGKSRTARAAHIFVDGVDLVRPGVASRLEVGDRGGLPKVLASRQTCAGLRAGAGQRRACQSACCVCHPHHLHDAVQAAQQAFGRALDAKCNGDDGKVAGQAKAAVRMTPTIKQLLMDHLKETLPPWVQLHHDPNKQARAFRVLVCGHGARCPVPIVDVCVCVCAVSVCMCVCMCQADEIFVAWVLALEHLPLVIWFSRDTDVACSGAALARATILVRATSAGLVPGAGATPCPPESPCNPCVPVCYVCLCASGFGNGTSFH